MHTRGSSWGERWVEVDIWVWSYEKGFLLNRDINQLIIWMIFVKTCCSNFLESSQFPRFIPFNLTFDLFSLSMNYESWLWSRLTCCCWSTSMARNGRWIRSVDDFILFLMMSCCMLYCYRRYLSCYLFSFNIFSFYFNFYWYFSNCYLFFLRFLLCLWS